MTASVTVAYPRSKRVPVKRTLMMSCASVAVAAAVLAPQKAHAQSVPGAFNGSFSSTDATQTITSPGNSQITVNNSAATINWIPTDTGTGGGTINFMPQGNTATYVNGSGVTDYTVLNRVVPADPSRAILLDGTVQSFINGNTGGNIWFYSPGGILVGAHAIFNVGGLLLSTVDVSSFTPGSNGFSASFNKTQSSAGAIKILSGAQLNALQQNSYIALVAPRIEQGGAVRVNGSAAYVAAEKLTMTMDQGLFDISVDVNGGTGDANGIVHTGSTTGTANQTAGDHHKIYMVAVPKNQALTMLLNGTMGFDPAVSASIENGQIVLGAGWSINDTVAGLGATGSNTSASIKIGGSGGAATFTSDVVGYANDAINVDATFGNVTFDGDLTLRNYASSGSGNIILSATSGKTLSVGGDLSLISANAALPSAIEINAVTGGTVNVAGDADLISANTVNGDVGSVSLNANNGAINIAGVTRLQASASAYQPYGSSTSQDHVGGTINVVASNNGTISTGELDLFAFANGDDNAGSGNGAAGDGIGGSIYVSAESGGDIDVDGAFYANADGYGGDMRDGSVLGGAGYGGVITLSQNGGSIHVGGPATMSAYGIGGSYVGEGIPTDAQGGFGQGGSVAIYSSGAGTIQFDDSLILSASGTGGNGQSGGDGYGGSASIYAYDGTAALGPSISVDADGHGGWASSGFGGAGGNGFGGSASIDAYGGIITGGDAIVDASGFGGNGGAGDGNTIAAGDGGYGQGGYDNGESGAGASIFVQSGASVDLGNVYVVSRGAGGNGGNGGAGYGGTADTTVYGTLDATSLDVQAYAWGGTGSEGNGGLAQAGEASIDVAAGGNLTYLTLLAVNATADGGDGLLSGGNGQGGYADITVDGTVAATSQNASNGTIILTTAANGGNGANGGTAIGGDNTLRINATGSVSTPGFVNLNAGAFGGDGTTSGGYAQGGSSTITLDGGSLSAGTIGDYANAWGGDGIDGGSGGDGAGGGAYLTFTANGGSLTVSDGFSSVEAIGFGGQGGDSATGAGGDGGDGYGGTATVAINAGSLTGGDWEVDSIGFGGDGGDGLTSGGDGGSATGALSHLILKGDMDVVNFFQFSRAYAGDGGAGATAGSGGDATGGNSVLEVLAGATANLTGSLGANSTAFGGRGADGGDAQGGFATASIAGTVNTADFQVTAAGFGGAGSVGTGGDGYGGQSDIYVGGQLTTDTGFMGNGGYGGNGVTAGGLGYGGQSYLSVAGDMTITTGFEIQDWATGGDASNGQGGYAEGGYGFVSAYPGGNLSGGELVVEADATGGDGAVAGSANGGQITISSDSSESNQATSIDLATLTLTATGAQGVGGGTGEGAPYGNAGNIYFYASGGTISAGVANLDASGSSDGGGIVMQSTRGYDGQAGSLQFGTITGLANGIYGGTISLAALEGTASNFGDATFSATGTGGAINVQAGDIYGTGTLSANSLMLDAAGIWLGTFYGGTIDVFTVLDANATGYVAMADDGNGGVISAETLDVSAASIDNSANLDVFNLIYDVAGDFTMGDFSVGGTMSISADGSLTTGNLSAGDSLSLTAGTTLAAGILYAGSDLSLTAGSDLVVGDLAANGNLMLDSGGDLTTGDLSAGGDINLTAGNDLVAGDLFAGADMTVDAAGNLTAGNLTAGGDLDLIAGNSLLAGDLYAGANLTLDAGGNLTAGDVTAGQGIAGTAGGNLTVGTVTSGFVAPPPTGDLSPNAVATGQDVNLSSGGDLSVEAINSAGGITLDAGGALSAGDLDAADDIAANSGNAMTLAGVTAGGAIALNSGADLSAGDLDGNGGVQASATGDMSLASVTSGGTVGLDAGGALDSGPIHAAGNVAATSGDDMTLASVTSGGGITLDAGAALTTGALDANGAVVANAGGDMDVGSASAGGDITLTSGGNLIAGPLDAGLAVTVTAAGDTSVSDVDAGTSATFTAGGLASFSGTVAAPTITVTSADIDIMAGAALGVAGLTELITFNAVSDGDVLIGGDDDAGDEYQLSEAGDIIADSIVFNAVNGNDVVVGDMQIEGSETDGGGISSVTLNTDGIVRIIGDLEYINAGTDDTLAINAGQAIEVITDSGSISMTDSSGDLSGVLELTADNIWVASQEIVSQLEVDPNYAGRDADLAANNGTNNPAGYIQAGAVTATVTDTLLVQNSGTADNPGGITVGDGGLTVVNAGSSPATAVVYGQQVMSDGTVVSGDAFTDSVSTQGSGGFTSGSTVNGCALGGCTVTPPPPPPPPPPPIDPPPPPPVEPPPPAPDPGPTPPPPALTGAESILGPVGLMASPSEVAAAASGDSDDADSDDSDSSDEDSDASVDVTLGIINAGPVSVDKAVDEPVTSGRDGDLGDPGSDN